MRRVLKAKVKGHKRQKKRVAATVCTSKGEARSLASSKVRWYSSSSRVAKVNKRGKVVLLRKGKALIWAKAHNGVNSKKIVVRVK